MYYISIYIYIFLSVKYTLLHTFHCKPLLFDRCQIDNVDNSHRCLIDRRMDGLASSMCVCRHTIRHIQYQAELFFLRREYKILHVAMVRALAKPWICKMKKREMYARSLFLDMAHHNRPYQTVQRRLTSGHEDASEQNKNLTSRLVMGWADSELKVSTWWGWTVNCKPISTQTML